MTGYETWRSKPVDDEPVIRWSACLAPCVLLLWCVACVAGLVWWVMQSP